MRTYVAVFAVTVIVAIAIVTDASAQATTQPAINVTVEQKGDVPGWVTVIVTLGAALVGAAISLVAPYITQRLQAADQARKSLVADRAAVTDVISELRGNVGVLNIVGKGDLPPPERLSDGAFVGGRARLVRLTSDDDYGELLAIYTQIRGCQSEIDAGKADPARCALVGQRIRPRLEALEALRQTLQK